MRVKKGREAKAVLVIRALVLEYCFEPRHTLVVFLSMKFYEKCMKR